MSYPHYGLHADLCDALSCEIDRANKKHGEGPIATPIQVVSILCEELGEFAQAVMQGRTEDARKELLQVAAVACNFLSETGPHFSNK